MHKVLLVDDEMFVRKGLRNLIDWEGLGFHVVGEAENGEEALSLIEQLNPDLVIADIRMPLLFFHHVSYKHRLKSGSTVIQHIYDTHFEGVERVAYFISRWSQLEGRMDSERYAHVQARLEEQLENAKQWRDIINTYFYRKSGISDEKERVIY